VLVAGSAAVGIATVVATGIGPSLPGPPVREMLGLAGAPGCEPNPAEVRVPEGSGSPSGRWRREPSFPIAQDELRAAAIGNHVYVASGVRTDDGGIESADDVFAFATADGTYRRLANLPMRVDHPLVVAHRGMVYVVGGFSDAQPSGRTWRYEPPTDRWTELASMRIPRGSPAGGVIGDRLYVVGGSPFQLVGSNQEASRVVEIYDFETDRWTDGPSAPTARHHHGAVALGGKLYVAGGRKGGSLSLEVFERFDPSRDRWERLPPLPQGAGGLAVASSGEEVIAVGGGDDGERWVTPATWAFHPVRETWRRLPDLNLARHGHGIAVANGRVYVFGGAPCVGFGTTDSVESLDAGDTLE
jgi:N-acetylneuraminic acid mutarotase